MIFGPYRATVAGVHDGDTMNLNIDLGFGLTGYYACRIYGINAPELATQAGKDALAFALTLVKVGDKVSVTSYGWDKYGGRFDGAVLLADGRDFAEEMLKGGHAVKL